MRVSQPVSGDDIPETSSLLISVSLPSVFLAGLGIFIPARSTDQSNLSHFTNDLLTGEIGIFQNGTEHQGPLGQKIWMKKFQISKERESIWEVWYPDLRFSILGAQGQTSIQWADSQLMSNNVHWSPGVKARRQISHYFEVGRRREQSSLLHWTEWRVLGVWLPSLSSNTNTASQWFPLSTGLVW